MDNATPNDVTKGGAGAAGYTPAYVNYALAMLTIVFTMNFLDRQIVTILAEPIKRDLKLADWQLGMMGGLAFALFYTVLGIPIARIADNASANRVWIISAALAVWSAMTALCGLAQNFVQLLLARIGVGVGEAGCTPPAHSLIADYVPAEKRASAIALYGLGIPIGTLIAFLAGGWMAQELGWRNAFLLVGLPGLALAVITALTLREPRTGRTGRAGGAAGGATFSEALREIAARKSFFHLATAAALISFVGYGFAFFLPSFFQRTHQMNIAEVGFALGVMSGVAGIAGMWLGGQIGDYGARKDVRLYAWAPALGLIVGAPFFLAAMLHADAVTALWLLAVPTCLNGLWYGPAFAAVQGLVAPRTRAMAAALLLFIVNIIGLGLGPLAVGLLSDLLAAGQGPAEGLRSALILAGLTGLWAALHFWRAGVHLRDELRIG